MNGILLLNKPDGISSFKAIRTVQKKLNITKIGHCGTLDPMATGMLPIVTNEGTKYSQYLLSSDKAYTVTMTLGYISDTFDNEGQIKKTKKVTSSMLSLVPKVINSFIGTYDQMPPKFSALKINGNRAYDLARQGVDFELKPRKITIHKLEVLHHENTSITLYVECVKGTYIRSLVNDIGEKLGCGAIMTKLHRNWVSPFNKQSMYNIDDLSNNHLIPIETIFKQKIYLSIDQTTDILHGKHIPMNEDTQLNSTQPIALFSGQNKFIGIGTFKTGFLYPKRLLSKPTD